MEKHLQTPFRRRKSLLRRVLQNWLIVLAGLLMLTLAVLVGVTAQNGSIGPASRHFFAIFSPPLSFTTTPHPALPGLAPTPHALSTRSQATILSATPHLFITPSSTPSSSPLPSLTFSSVGNHQTATLTPGPLAETPFGQAPAGNGRMLVHVAKRGDTWELLARQYDTSVPVLQVVNPREGQQSIWEGEPLVILPGVMKAAGLGPLKATNVDGHWEISP